MARLDDVARFERHVDRSGEHHRWTGAVNPQRGTGKLKVGDRQVTAHRRAWELANGEVAPGCVVLPCAEDPLCVRVEHLRLSGEPAAARPRSRKGSGSTRVQVQMNGIRAHRRVRGGRDEVSTVKALLREELRQASPPDEDATRWRMNDLLEHYLAFLDTQGRERRTLIRYEGLARNWVAPVIGDKLARQVRPADLDRCLSVMRRGGQSAPSMSYAKALLSGAFKWAKRTGKVLSNPAVDLQLPKSTYVPAEKLPPEAADVSLILGEALVHTPDIAPILTLAATTGARLGELVALRVADIDERRQTLAVRSAMDIDGSVKDPKRPMHRRYVDLDDATLAMLRRHVEEMAERAAMFGLELASDAFVFSVEPDCSKPIPSIRVTKRLQLLKGHLGVEDKRPETVALEDEALRLRREGSVDRSGRPGPRPVDGAAMSYDDIAEAFGRTQMWAKRACEAALRREKVGVRRDFNLSFNGLRKFTSSELLDAGFNLSVVAQRQGHGPEVLAKHYSKARPSARRKAAAHLGRVVHGARGDPAANGG